MLNNQLYPTLNLINPLHTHTHTHKHTFASKRLSETSSCWIRPCNVSSFSSHTQEKRLRKRDVCVMKWLMKAMVRFWLIASTWKQRAKHVKLVQYIIYKVLRKETKTDDEMLLTLVTANRVTHNCSQTFTGFYLF